MKRLGLVSLLLPLAGGIALGQGVSPNVSHIRYSLVEINGHPSSYYADQFSTMTRALKLTPDQTTKIKADVDAMNDALDSAQEDAFGPPAQNGGGLPRFPNAADMKKLDEKLTQITNENEIKILADLDDDQKLTWAKSTLDAFIRPQFNDLNLTPEQIDKSTALIAGIAKDLAAAKDAQSYTSIQGHMVRKWIGDILTDQQASRILHTKNSPAITGRQVATPHPPKPGDDGLP